MAKKLLFKTLIGFSGIVLLAGGFFSFPHFFGKTKKEIQINSSDSSGEKKPDSVAVTGNGEKENDESMQNVFSSIAENEKQESENLTASQNSVSQNLNNVPETGKEDDGNLRIVNKLVNWGYEKSTPGRPVDTLVIHSSADVLGSNPYSVDGIIKEFKMYEVAAHYIVDRKGVIYRLVEDNDVAYHAGASRVPDGRTGVNQFSIGIELVNTKTGNYTAKQYEALNELIKALKKKYRIKYVLGHNQIAPERKDDPWNFNWNKLK